MSLWYRTGTISITNGTSALTGVGTAWVANVSPGMMVVYDRQIIGEVQSVNSNTSITLATAYAGTTISGGAYAIANLGAVRDGLIAAVNDALAAFQAEQDGPLSGRFGDGTLAEPGLAFLADLNTGFRRPAADQIGMVTGGVQRALLSSAAMQVDVPVTGTAVQSSATDTTAGRLMKVGAFGLGIADSIPAPASIDTLTATGFYRYATGVTGAPSSAGIVLHMARLSSSGASGFMQVAFGVSSQIFVRHLTDTVGPVWSAWTEVTTALNVGAHYAALAAGAVGSHLVLTNTSGSAIAQGATVAGSALTPSQSGTWMALSSVAAASSTVFRRVS